jgi:hypothetical protein
MAWHLCCVPLATLPPKTPPCCCGPLTVSAAATLMRCTSARGQWRWAAWLGLAGKCRGHTGWGTHAPFVRAGNTGKGGRGRPNATTASTLSGAAAILLLFIGGPAIATKLHAMNREDIQCADQSLPARGTSSLHRVPSPSPVSWCLTRAATRRPPCCATSWKSHTTTTTRPPRSAARRHRRQTHPRARAPPVAAPRCCRTPPPA